MRDVPRLLPPGEAARRLQVHTRTVSRWADRGLLRMVRTPTGQRRYLERDVDGLAERIAAGTAPDLRVLRRPGAEGR